MNVQEENKLDNPVWYSLSEDHRSFAVEYPNIKFYQPDYCPFGGFDQNENITEYISDYSKLADNFFIVGEKPPILASLKLKNELVCLQMIIRDKIQKYIKENILKLDTTHLDELFQLVNLVQPGYFKSKTFFLGNYYGIFKNNKLVAVTGERMQMNKYVEVSAVVTHPEHTGNGYAKQLVAHTVNTIFDKNKIPYLHVAEINLAAIDLYKKLGFEIRRNISFWTIIKGS